MTLNKPFTLLEPLGPPAAWDTELCPFSRPVGRSLFKRKKLLALIWGAQDCMDLVRVLWLLRERHMGEMAEVCRAGNVPDPWSPRPFCGGEL